MSVALEKLDTRDHTPAVLGAITLRVIRAAVAGQAGAIPRQRTGPADGGRFWRRQPLSMGVKEPYAHVTPS